jgi:TolB-like protein
MKKILCTLFILAFAGTAQAQEKPKIAVLGFKAGVGVTQSDIDGIQAILITYLNDNPKFTVVERSQIDKLIREQGLQRSSITQPEVIAKMSEILNVSKVVVGDINIVSGQYNIDCRILDAQTGVTESTAGEMWVRGTAYREVMKRLAQTLGAKMKFSAMPPATPNPPAPTTSSKVVTLYGYLTVYPEDLGHFTVYPVNLINVINQNATEGYDDWRLPTEEELQVMQANKSKISGFSGGRYAVAGGPISNGRNIRLVTTGKLVAVKKAEAEEQKRDGVTINGVVWATCNVGERGTFVSQPHHSNNYYTWHETQNVCPTGWRLPTENEIDALRRAPNRWTTINGVDGREFGTPPNTVFLPAAGSHSHYHGGLILVGSSGSYWSSTQHESYNAYSLGFNSSSINKYYSNRKNGFSLRCVADK